jgi:hypothetical protein
LKDVPQDAVDLFKHWNRNSTTLTSVDTNKGFAEGNSAKIELFAAGMDKGRTGEHSDWVAEGHGQNCFQPTVVHPDSGIQTNPPPLVTTNASQSQTDSQPPTSVITTDSFAQTENHIDHNPCLMPLISIPPSPSPITPTSPVPAPTPSYRPVTDAVSIERLVGFAKNSPNNSVLGIVWRYVFEEGNQTVVCITVAGPPEASPFKL